MFSSLRTRLIVAFSFVIFLSLFLAGSAFLYLLRDYQGRLAERRLMELAGPMATQARALERIGASPSQIVALLQDQVGELGVIVLLVDPEGKVVEATAESLQGATVKLPPREALTGAVVHTGRYHSSTAGDFFFAASLPRQPSPLVERFLGRVPTNSVVLALPERSLAAGWWELAPSLSIAGLLSLLVSLLVAVFISRSITKPMAEITEASEEMARGHYDQTIRVKGRDEIARLAIAFNAMASQVALSHRTTKQFLADISHELKTPLTSIRGFAQAILDAALKGPEEYRESAEIIHEEAGRMGRLVDDLIYLSKIEAHQLPIDRQALNLGDLLRAGIKRFRQLAQQRGVELSLKEEVSPMIEGDHHQLEQLFGNLLSNALKYTPPGGAVTVKLAEEADPGSNHNGGLALVAVHNTGSSIKSEDLPRVFERFYQGDGSRAGEGSGLGLAIAKEIAEAHSGTIRVQSSPETGTEFLVALPLCPNDSRKI